MIITLDDIIGEMISHFEIRFNDLAVTALKEVKKGNKASMEDFKIDLTLLPSKIRHDHLMFLQESLPSLTEALNLQEIFQHFNLYWDYFNYTLLEEIVNRYGSDSLKHQMKSYISDLHQFWQNTLVADFIPHCKNWNKFETIPEEFLQLKIKHELDKEVSEHKLFELEELRRHFQLRYQLPDFAMILYELQEGSLEVTWLVAKELQCLKKDLRRELSDKYEKETQRIVSISLGSECIQPVSLYIHPFPLRGKLKSCSSCCTWFPERQAARNQRNLKMFCHIKLACITRTISWHLIEGGGDW